MAARKLLLLRPRSVVFTIGDLLNKGIAMPSRYVREYFHELS
jgi:hypothetical protein